MQGSRMIRKYKILPAVLIFATIVGLPTTGGCVGSIAQNLLAEKTGNVTVTFVNNTPYRAIVNLGAYDAWNRLPGEVDLEQLTIDPYTSSDPTTITCARNTAVGTDRLVQRVIATDTDQGTNFDAELFDSVVRFSSAPAGTDAASLPTAGTAEGVEKMLGVDYSCGDQLIFTFIEDPDAEGGFRIDYEVILDEEKD